MLRTAIWTVTSRLAIAASWLPYPVYRRLLAYALQPALQLARTGSSADTPASRKTLAIAMPPTAALEVAPRPFAAVPLSAPEQAIPRDPGPHPRALVIDGFTPTPDKDAASNDIYWFMRI